MLILATDGAHLRVDNDFGPDKQTVTRYRGERWPQVGAALLCGIADVFPDVGIITIGKSSSFSGAQLDSVQRIDGIEHRGWLGLDQPERRFKPVYARSEELGWIFVPSCREDVIEIIGWTMWHLKNDAGGFRSIAFSGGRDFRDALDSENWTDRLLDVTQLVQLHCLSKPLFEFIASPGSWLITPDAVDRDHLFRLTHTVAARISTSLSC